MSSLFTEFVGKEVKAPYRDGSQYKIARGTLSDISDGFVKIKGKLGTIIINEKNVEKWHYCKGEHKQMGSLFNEFVGKEVKAPYRDGSQYKIARGVLADISDGFVKIKGKLGTIIINEKNVEKMALLQN